MATGRISTMTLYEKVTSKGGKISYLPYERKAKVDMELTNAEVCSLVAALGICCLHGFENHLPEHSAISRRVRALEVAIGDVAGLNYHELSKTHLDAATHAWGAAVQRLQYELSKGA